MTSRTRLGWYIARRYLASKKGGMLSFITAIALGGVIVGVTALVVVIGVMTGMQDELREKILGSNPHIMVQEAGAAIRLNDWQGVREKILTVPGVESASPVLATKVALYRSDYAEVLDLYGVDLSEATTPVTAMEDSLRSGLLPLTPSESGLTPVVLGSGVAQRMNLFRGDTLTVMSLENFSFGPFGDFAPAMAQWEVSGIFSTGMYDYDMRNGYASMESVQGLLGVDDPSTTGLIGVRISDPWAAESVAEGVREVLGGWPYFVDPWTVRNQQLFSALKLEKLAMSVILGLIVLVAAFNIVGTLAMVVVNRTREIGILKSMGLNRTDILRAFLFQGLWIGIIGTASGLGLGIVLLVLIEKYQLIPIPPDVYFVDRLPVSISVWDIVAIGTASVLISLLATIYPARQAASLDPVEAIRHE